MKKRSHAGGRHHLRHQSGGLVEITPLFFQKQTTEPVEGLKPYTALQMEGRDIFIREGCTNCHSQMIRPFRAETERYGHYSVAGESVWEHPFLWGSSVLVGSGPCWWPLLRRVAQGSPDQPARCGTGIQHARLPWLDTNVLTGEMTGKKLALFRDHFGVPYTDADIQGAGEAVKGKTELDALVAYLQSLGHALK